MYLEVIEQFQCKKEELDDVLCNMKKMGYYVNVNYFVDYLDDEKARKHKGNQTNDGYYKYVGCEVTVLKLKRKD